MLVVSVVPLNPPCSRLPVRMCMHPNAPPAPFFFPRRVLMHTRCATAKLDAATCTCCTCMAGSTLVCLFVYFCLYVPTDCGGRGCDRASPQGYKPPFPALTVCCPGVCAAAVCVCVSECRVGCRRRRHGYGKCRRVGGGRGAQAAVSTSAAGTRYGPARGCSTVLASLLFCPVSSLRLCAVPCVCVRDVCYRVSVWCGGGPSFHCRLRPHRVVVASVPSALRRRVLFSSAASPCVSAPHCRTLSHSCSACP